jgi:hypothetical protein
MNNNPLYRPQDLASAVAALSSELKLLKNEVADLERVHKESQAMATENTALKKETREIQIQFLRAMPGGRKQGERRFALRLSEVYRHDLDKIRAQQEKGEKKS